MKLQKQRMLLKNKLKKAQEVIKKETTRNKMLGGERRGWGDGVVESGKLYGSLGKETN